jgi:hypothetical protein
MANPVPLKLALSLGPEAHAEELDEHSRRLRRDLKELGVEADLVRDGPAPEGTKSAGGTTPGQLGVNAQPEQLAALVGVLGQWTSFDPSRAATLSNIPPEQLAVLSALVLAAMPRMPARFARFAYKDGDRQIEFEYDPATTDPQKLLAEIKATVQSTVNITAQGNITIGGNVVGRDQTTTSVSGG